MENKDLETARHFLSGLEHCYFSMLEFERQHKLTFIGFGTDLHRKLEFIRAYVAKLEERTKED